MKAFPLTLLSLVIACGVHAQSPKEPLGHPNPAKEASKPDERGTEQAPFVIKAIPTPKTEAEAAAEAQDKQEKTANDRQLVYWTRALLGVGIVQFLVLVVQAIVFGRQARRLRQTVDEMKIATKATEKAANAAERTVSTMKDTAERQLRAYVSIATIEITDLKAGLTPIAHVVVRNYGQTPAYELTSIQGMSMGVSWDALTPPSPEPIEVTATSLAPSAIVEQDISAPRPLVADEREALLDGSKTLWVYGEMRYKDAFKIERFTEFRYQVGGKARLRKTHMAISPDGNRET